jgi:hypothetical protein
MSLRKIFVGLIVFCTVLSSFAGWEYSATTRAEGSQHSEMMNNEMTSWVDGDKAKVEFVKSGSPLTPAGSFVITKDGGKMMYMVNPPNKTYSKWDVASMAGLAGGAMQMMNMKMSTPKVEKLLEEKGGKIAGFATTHYRFRTSYTMEMSFMGIQRSTATVTEEDVWSCAQLNDAGLTAWMNQQGTKTGNEQLDKLVKAEMEKVKGFPLKRVVTTTSKESNGEPQVMKMTTEVSAIKKSSPDAGLFEIPAGYKEAPMFSSMGGASSSAGKDSKPKPGASDENPFMKIMQQMNKK